MPRVSLEIGIKTNALQSYLCGSLNILGWTASTAGICIIPAQQIMAMVHRQYWRSILGC
jgi:hypothetical protein